MKNAKNILMLKAYFNFLMDKYEFRIQDFDDTGYSLSVKFVSDKVGVYFIYEFRDSIPQVQFSIIDSKGLNIRPGIYTIKELYGDIKYQLKSFYLNEILSFQGKDYKGYFRGITTVEDAIKISSRLIKDYATDYLNGDEIIYLEINQWFRHQVEHS